MVKKKLIQTLLISLCFVAGCGRCKDDKMTYNAMSNKIYEYSYMYREGNWWIYANQDSSKLDTMYVTDFKDSTEKDYIVCSSNQRQTFKLHSMYFLGLRGNIINGVVYVNNSAQAEGLFLQRGDSLDKEAKYQSSTIGFSYNGSDTAATAFFIVNGDTFEATFSSLGYDTGVFSKEAGILLYTNSTFNHDTFRLIKYYIQ